VSDRTKSALDDAIRAHVSAEGEGDLTTAWLLIAGIAAHDRSADILWDGPDDQPGYVTVGLAHMLVDLTAGKADRDD